jgi:hypothetical protein
MLVLFVVAKTDNPVTLSVPMVVEFSILKFDVNKLFKYKFEVVIVVKLIVFMFEFPVTLSVPILVFVKVVLVDVILVDITLVAVMFVNVIVPLPWRLPLLMVLM